MAHSLEAKPTGVPVLSQITRDLQPDRLVPALTTGLVIGILMVMIAISFAALIYTDDLSGFASSGIGFILMGSAIVAAVVALLGSHPSAIALDQDISAAILALVAASTLGTIPAATSEQKFATVVILVIGSTLTTGLLFLLLGRYRLGDMIRFLPYPVVGGFLAGTGWLLASGAIGVMAGTTSGLALWQPEMLARWLPGLILALALLLVLNRYQHFLILPGMFLGTIALFYVVLWLAQIPLAQVSAQGWLLGPLPGGGLWHFPLTPSTLAQVDWAAAIANAANAAPVVIVTVIAFSLNVSGLELVVAEDIDLNREFVITGLANLVSGLAGGIVGFHAISLSSLNHRLSGSSRLAALITAALCAAAAFWGASLLAYVPRLVLGGLLLFLGLSFLFEWIVQARSRFSRFEYGIILLILVIIAAFGFLAGVAVGLVAAVALFVINYSRVNVVKHTLSGVTYQSRVKRSRRQHQILQQQGEQIHILQLHGFIFFGTANRLLDQVRQRFHETEPPPARFIMLDFQQVTGLDSTAVFSFARMKQLAQIQNSTLVFTHLTPLIYEQFARSGLDEETGVVRIFPDLDRGVEWCEENILRAAASEDEAKTLADQLAEILRTDDKAAALLAYLERQDVEPGTYLMRQGDICDNVYFVEAGQVTAQLELAGQAPIRLETMGGGHVVGEIGFYLGARRTAAVVVDEPGVVYRLSLAQLQQMEKEDPEAASTFHRLIVHLLAERVVHLIKAVDALLR